jgi:hypothetical protein
LRRVRPRDRHLHANQAEFRNAPVILHPLLLWHACCIAADPTFATCNAVDKEKAVAQIFGTKASGKLGVLDKDELAALIRKKSGERAAEQSCNRCATHILDMKDSKGGGGITTKYAKRSVFHISSGKRGGGDGCSVFFTLSNDSGETPTAGIVAVGWHTGANDHTYQLDWGKGPPFFTGNRLDTSVQEQQGNKQ